MTGAPPRLVVVDLDGTLLGSDGEVSERNAIVLRRATAAGCRVVVATGRPARLLGPIESKGFATTVLCYNGAIVLDLPTGNVLAANLLDGALFLDAARHLRAAGYEFVVGVEGLPAAGIRAEAAFRPGLDLPRGTLDELCDSGIVKALVRVTGDDFEGVWNALVTDYSGTLTVTRSGIDQLIEISGVGVSKGDVIDGLARQWGVDSRDAIAFGDMPNDLDLLRWAGRSIAMGNAEPEVKLAATETGLRNDEDGVAVILERWF